MRTATASPPENRIEVLAGCQPCPSGWRDEGLIGVSLSPDVSVVPSCVLRNEVGGEDPLMGFQLFIVMN